VLTRLAFLASLVATLLVTPAGAGAADAPECKQRDAITGICTITITPPGSSPGARPVSDASERAEDDGPACASRGEAVPCSDPLLGSWSNNLGCYLRAMSPPPAPDSPLWEGNYPRGAVYVCQDPRSGPFSGVSVFWLPGPPEVGMTPEQAARAVVRRMDLRAADIGIVPEDRPGSIGAVGAPVYMWTARGPARFGPQTLTGSAGGVTISATARVDRIVWSMGDGATVTCRTPGTPYEDRYGFNPSPDCGHRYNRTSTGQPGNAYPITATSFWVVNWTGPGGSAGQITLDLTSRTSIQVGELQALVTR
jgi:hypothetical protein